MAILDVQHIEKHFGDTPVLKDISFSLEEGQALSIIGSSGSGKTTLLRCLNFLETPDKGVISVRGEKLFDAAEHDSRSESDIRKKRLHFGLVFQSFNLFPQYTALQNVTLARELMAKSEKTGESHESIVAEGRRLLEDIGLGQRMDNYPHQLSGGQQQRVAIARALATNPKILLCDEATSALDPTTTRSILALLKEINKTLGITIIVITHEMAVIEEICQRVAIIDSSRIAEVGTVDEVFTRPKSAMAKQLIYPDGKRNSLATGKRYCRIVFDGNSSFEPVVSNMVLECKAPVKIMFADTKNIDGKAYGQMILQLPEDERAAKRALAYLETQNVHAEEVADYASV